MDDRISKRALSLAFPGIPEREAKKLIERGRVASYPNGTDLCIEGNVEDVFYVLLSGEVKVTKEISLNDNRLLKFLNPGDFFGEMGIIHDAPRAATVSTTKDSSVLEIDKEGFQESLQESSTVSLAMVREVSRRLRENDEMAIEDLRTKAGELAHAYQQLAELDLARREFLTTIAHELRTPLTSASGFLQMIKMGYMEGDALNDALEKVSRNVDQIVSLTNDILFLQEMDLILSEFETIHLGKLVIKILREEREHADQMGVDIRVGVAPDLPEVPADIKSLQRALSAIINNAIKFSLNGGTLEVVVDHNPNSIWVTVRDHGIGISQDDMPYIYDRFWRTEEHDGHLFGGVGLGLSIAKQVIEQHGGEILLQSGVGQGTSFTVRLALSPLLNPDKANFLT
ncbi:MAG: ATP-binding protein [Chloroflexota bacterium]